MSKKVLVTVLDWGLGHATRSVPIIRELQERNHEVLIGSAGDAFGLLKMEFPSIDMVELPAYNPSYNTTSMTLNMLMQLPRFISRINEEHKVVGGLVKHEKIDVIISDNRYGCCSDYAKSVFVTHQLNIMTPAMMRWTKPMIDGYNKQLVSQFDECWIPDFPDRRLSGKLSENSAVNPTFIGPLSRIRPGGEDGVQGKYFLLAVLSGPEPQRSHLEKILLPQLEKIDKPCCIVRGIIDGVGEEVQSKHGVVDYAEGETLAALIRESEVTISRSGYSTIMDLSMIGKKAIFIPTPQQPEQEYLAACFDRDSIARAEQQDTLDLRYALDRLGGYSGIKKVVHDADLLGLALSRIGL